MHVAHLYVSKQINSCTLLVSGKVINEEKNVFLAQREFKILINQFFCMFFRKLENLPIKMKILFHNFIFVFAAMPFFMCFATSLIHCLTRVINYDFL